MHGGETNAHSLGHPELSKSYMDRASKLFTFIFTVTPAGTRMRSWKQVYGAFGEACGHMAISIQKPRAGSPTRAYLHVNVPNKALNVASNLAA